jgi:chromatin-remodeling ATPase INO80
MESNFHSTVLQRPNENDEDRDRRHRRDILNSTSSVVAPPPVSAPQQPATRHSNFSLRSPTQSEFHRQPAFSSPTAPSNNNNNTSHQSPRSGLHSPFVSSNPASGPVPPSLPPPSTASASSAAQHQGAPLSPLHAPTGYYPPPAELHPTREKPATSSFYDPLTDTTKERRTSETGTWSNPPQVSTPKVSVEIASRCSAYTFFFFFFLGRRG